MAISEEKKGTIAVSLTNFLDSGCIVASASAMTIWAAEFGFNELWIAILGAIGANAFGAAVGALIGGFLTDKFGRTVIYKYNLLIYALGVLLCACAINLPMLCAGVIISGLCVGAGVPASWSYISEMSGSTRRCANIGISQFAWALGPAIIFALSLFMSIFIPGMPGMRIIFALLFIIALIAWNMQRKLRESKDWIEKQKAEENNKSKVSFGRMMLDALKNPVNIKAILFLIAVYLTWNIVAGTMGQFMPYLYSAAGHLNPTQISILQTVLWCLTALSALFIFGKFGDRIPYRVLFFTTSLMGIIAWCIMVFFGFQLAAGTEAEWGWLLWIFASLWGIAHGFGAQTFYALWSTELFSRKYRGGVQGIMFFLVRGVLGFWSLFCIAGLGVETPQGFITAGIIMVGFLLISGVVGTIGCPKTQGKTLDEITIERYGTLD